MSLSRRVFWSIFLAVAAAIGLEALSDVAIDRLQRSQEQRTTLRIEEQAEHFESRLQRSPHEAATLLRRFDAAGREVVAWLPGSLTADAYDEALSTFSGVAWAAAEVALSDGRLLVLRLERSGWEQLLAQPLLLDSLDAPILLVAGLLLALWSARSVRAQLRRIGGEIAAGSQGRVPTAIGVPTEDPEMAEVVRAYNRMTEVAARYLEREQTFTRYAAHELRTPLAAVRVQLERLEAGTASVVEVQDAMRRNLERMEVMMNALLALARGRNRSDATQSLWSIIDDVMAGAGTDSERSKRVRVEWGGLDAPPGIELRDAPLVRQAVENLVDNALRHTTGAVNLRLYRQGEVLTVRVRDFGEGVPAAQLGRLTEPFFRTGNTSKPGLGLGLALVELVCRVLEGEVAFDEAKPGLVATLRLPVVALGSDVGG